MGVVAGVVPTVHEGSRVRTRRFALAVALLVLNVADVLVTRALLDRGGVEMNPLMRDLMGGLAAPLGLKMAVAALVGGLLLACPERSRLADRAVTAIVAAYSLIVVWNLALVVQLSI